MYQLEKVEFITHRDFECQINTLRAKGYYIIQILEFKNVTPNDKGKATILFEQK